MLEYFYVYYVQLQLGYIGIFSNFFIVAGIPPLLTKFRQGELKRQIPLVLLHIVLCLAVNELLCAAVYAVFGITYYGPVICRCIVLVLYALLCSRYCWPLRAVYSCIYFAAFNLAMRVTTSIGSLLGLEYGYLQWTLLAILATVLCCTVVFVKYFSVSEQHSHNPAYISICCAIGLIVGIFACIIRTLLQMNSGSVLSVSILLIFIIFGVYFGVSAVTSWAGKKINRQAEAALREAHAEALRVSERNLESLRLIRHEMKNQFAYINALLEKGDYQKLHEHFSAFAEIMNRHVTFIDCGNDTFSAVISIEDSKAKRAGIDLQCKVAVPHELAFEDVDICSLLMNLVNNAIEYYERNPDFADKRIRIEAVMVNKTLLVTVANPVQEADAESAIRLKTSKKDTELHGYGSKVVRTIAEKYNGSVRYTAENGEFVACAMLCDRGGEPAKEEQNA